jgi:hypothetical protein
MGDVQKIATSWVIDLERERRRLQRSQQSAVKRRKAERAQQLKEWSEALWASWQIRLEEKGPAPLRGSRGQL